MVSTYAITYSTIGNNYSQMENKDISHTFLQATENMKNGENLTSFNSDNIPSGITKWNINITESGN